jgi:Trk-type K+ transport system membrane component
MPLYKFRERVNLLLYDNKDQVLRMGKILNVLISLGAVLVLVYYYGFQHAPEQEAFLMNLIKFSFGFYVLHYLVRFIYDFRPIDFIKRTWFEGTIMFLLTIEGISYNLFDTLLFAKLASGLGIESFADVSTVFIQIYILIVVMIGLGRGSISLPKYKLNPALIFILSFSLIIFTGCCLLMLPEMTTMEGSMNALDALFTSTSAACVTGLMIEDASTFFTFKGQVVLLILMKLGGLNIIAFGSFLALATRFGVQAKQHEVIEDFINKETPLSSNGMFAKIVIWATSIELIGAAMIFPLWNESVVFTGNGERAFYSLFHSISGFNNAGIALFPGGLGDALVYDNYLLHWVMIGLMFLGALGMVALFEIFDPHHLRERMKAPWKRLSFMSQIALYTSIGFAILGCFLFFALEYNNSLKDAGLFGKITTSMFQGLSARTAGLNTLDIGLLSLPTLFFIIIFMFIGSSSSSTGGGIKTSTFAVIMADLWATVKRRNHTSLFRRTISNELKARAYAVLMFFLLFNLIGIFILFITESDILNTHSNGAIALIFEQVSAMSTNGLSAGITAMLSSSGKTWIIISMFVGRVGTLTVAYSLGFKTISKNYKYPNGHTMIG